MDHAVTIGGLIATLGIVAGLLVGGYGALAFLGSSMSDVGDQQPQGCVTLPAGIIIIVACVSYLVLRG